MPDKPYWETEQGWDTAGNCIHCGEAGRCECSHPPKIDDHSAIEAIHQLLDGQEWSPGSEFLDQIASVVRSTGRTIREPEV